MMKEKLEAVQTGMLQKLASRKRKGAILGFDSVNYLLVLIIFVGLGVAGLGALEGYRIITAKMELREISAAYATYKSLRNDGKGPSTLGTLIDKATISSGDAVDGVEHGNFLKQSGRWTTNALLDPWGNEYTVNGNDIQSKGGPLNSEPLTEAIGVENSGS